MTTIFLLWILIFGVFCCAGFLGAFLWQNRYLARTVEIQLQGMSETQMLTFEALERELKRLEKRVKEVEDVVL
jgi:hypothetical protein